MENTKSKLGEGATPGPWKFSGSNSWEVYSTKNGVPICRISAGANPLDAVANGRLIAATPLLVEARDVLQDIATYLDNRADVDDGIPNSAMKLYVKLLDLLAKLDEE